MSITVKFSKDMNPATINAGTFTLSDGTNKVAGNIAYDSAIRTASFTPTQKLANATTYSATVSGVADKAGNQLVAPYNFSFTTEIARNIWYKKASMPTPRYQHSSSVVDGKIYVIGGRDNAGTLNTVEVYDPVANSWISSFSTNYPWKAMPTPRFGHSSSVIDKKIYVIGGVSGSAILNTLEVYDPATNSWKSLTPMPTPRLFHSSSEVDGKIYVLGGRNNAVPNLGTLEVYDPVTNVWESKNFMLATPLPYPPMPTPRYGHSASVANEKIYVMGGMGFGIQNTLEVYAPLTNSWGSSNTMFSPSNPCKAMPTPLFYHSSSEVNGKIYVIGGYDVLASLNPLYVYDSVANSWNSTLAPMPTPRFGHSSSMVNEKIYVIGGYNGSVHFSSVEEYTP
ncbi:MAG: Ig-like domain-containing protein [Nitrospinota bacterium]|nr:Ig-like domain-containing protein [Nitrospinota bacterium]